MNRLVCDASPLIVLAKSGLIPVLTRLSGQIIVPQTVLAECTVEMEMPGAQAVHAAVKSGQIEERPDIPWPRNIPGEDHARLDAGELAAIRLAAALQCPVLMDERLGRQAAKRSGVTVIGSAGLLLVAKGRGLIPAVAPILDEWRGSGYFLSASLVEAILERAGEA